MKSMGNTRLKALIPSKYSLLALEQFAKLSVQTGPSTPSSSRVSWSSWFPRFIAGCESSFVVSTLVHRTNAFDIRFSLQKSVYNKPFKLSRYSASPTFLFRSLSSSDSGSFFLKNLPRTQICLHRRAFPLQLPSWARSARFFGASSWCRKYILTGERRRRRGFQL